MNRDGVDYIALLEKHKTQESAAKAAGISRRTFVRKLKKQKNMRDINKLGLSMTEAENLADNNQIVKGVSSLVDKDGNVKLRWLKTDTEKQAMVDNFERIGNAILQEIKPRPTIAPPKVKCYKQMLSCYVLADFHLGMYSNFDKELWNTEIARQTLYRWVDRAVESSIPSDTGLFIQLGDFFHANDSKGVTPASGHILDIDTSWDDVIDIGMEAMEYAIEKMLMKHNKLHVIIAEANHDKDAAKWMQRWFNRLYQNNERVTIDCTKGGYYGFKFGNTSIYAHHGHSRNLNDISRVLTGMYHEMFGQTQHRYAHLGHFHHVKRKPIGDDGLMDCQVHSTLAAKDQYAVTNAYLSQRGSKTIFYHKEYGYAGENNITPAMLM